MNIFKFYVRKMLGLTVHYYYPRAPIPAATHVPVLLGLGKFFDIATVLEFGAGKFSTATFLDRQIFPHVRLVQSLETDPEWKQRVEREHSMDDRLAIDLIDSDVSRIAANCDYRKFDLVFIDNGPARAETIQEVVRHFPEWKLVVIHDFENPPYKKAAEDARHKFCFDAYCPHTGVLWNPATLKADPRPAFRTLNRTLKRGAKTMRAEDTETWMRQLVALPGTAART